MLDNELCQRLEGLRNSGNTRTKSCMGRRPLPRERWAGGFDVTSTRSSLTWFQIPHWHSNLYKTKLLNFDIISKEYLQLPKLNLLRDH